MKITVLLFWFFVVYAKLTFAGDQPMVRPILCKGNDVSSVPVVCPIYINNSGFVVDRTEQNLLPGKFESSVETQYNLFYSGKYYGLEHEENSSSKNFELILFSFDDGRISIKEYFSLSKSTDEDGPYWKGIVCEGATQVPSGENFSKFAFDSLCGESVKEEYIKPKKLPLDVQGTIVSIPSYNSQHKKSISTDLLFLKDDEPSLQTLVCLSNCPGGIVPMTYTGVIDGKFRISMLINKSKSHFSSGFYQYDKYRKDIDLVASLTNSGIVLKETDVATGKSSGQFEIQPLTSTFYVGRWRSIGGNFMPSYFGRRIF